MELDITSDDRDVIVVALERWLSDVRQEYEDALDVGANTSGIRATRDVILATLRKVKGDDSRT